MTMERGASQLLYHYLPHRTVDWDDGRAIVELGGVRLKSAWSDARVAALLEEVATFFEYWRREGGAIDRYFPNPATEADRFTVGEPVAIEAFPFDTAYRCRTCTRLYFLTPRALANENSLVCARCGTATLRQFNFLFVHGCGEINAIEEFLPAFKKVGTAFAPISAPRLRCHNCGTSGEPAIPSNSERIRDMSVVCLKCKQEIAPRLDANCGRCLTRISAERERAVDDPDSEKGTAIARSAMRVARYNQSEAYYAQSISILRLDRTGVGHESDDQRLRELHLLMPLSSRKQVDPPEKTIADLSARLQQAIQAGQQERAAELYKAIGRAAARGADPSVVPASESSSEPLVAGVPEDVLKSARESYALLTQVSQKPALAEAREGGGISATQLAQVEALMKGLGLEDLSVVADLPIISSTFGYTRRAFQPTYDELSAHGLPTELRAFPTVDDIAARSLGRPELAGTMPILAREADHEGLFFSLSPAKVLLWLERNGVSLPSDLGSEPQLTALLKSLEPIDRYYDRIWATRIRRYLFGLVHSMSHLVMRSATRFAGLDRTSLSEYLFLPLLGGVVYDNASIFQLGGLRTLARDHLPNFLSAITDEATRCVYDPDCVDRRGACHGCIHSPEISCRVFNHGLSRAFLVGGHAPWADVTAGERIVGFWEI